jgi:cell division protein FtsI/penicillin-binding protein 2
MPLEFDLPVTKSRIIAPIDAFERAEVASGYNTRTTLSPLHAALIAALPASGGKILRPYIIEQVTAADGKPIYTGSVKILSQPLSAHSAAQLGELMQETVQNGTARNSFTYTKKVAAARGWTLGGKTGSIDLPGHTGRCDWFAGFGQSSQTSVAVACILVHGAQRTMRSSFVGAELIRGCLDPSDASAVPQVQAKKKTARGKTKSLASATTDTSSQKKKKATAPVHEAAKPKTKKQKAPHQNTGG